MHADIIYSTHLIEQVTPFPVFSKGDIMSETTPLISKPVDDDFPEWVLYGAANSMDPRLYRAETSKSADTASEATPPTSEPVDANLREEILYGAANSMDPDLYKAATQGDILEFVRAMQQEPADRQLGLRANCVQASPLKNTFLHIATEFGNDEIVKLICKDLPFLVTEKNSSGDTALHIAARAGNGLLVNLLVNSDEIILGYKNEEGNTALHEALRYRHKEIAQKLIMKDLNMSYSVNNEGESLLYLAAEAGYVDLVKLIMENPVGIFDRQARQNKSPAHAAILGRNINVLKLMWERDQSSFYIRCEKGMNPLHCAASIGYVEGVNFLLEVFYVAAYQRDNNGFYPILVASSKGHTNIVEEIIQQCPDARELLNQQGQNIFHVAAKSGKATAVSYMLNMPELENLINHKDEDGNTALHLATIYGHPNIVRDMSWDERVDLKLENNEGLTAFDIAEEYMKANDSFRKLLTWMALRVSPRSLHSKVFKTRSQNPAQGQSPQFENYKHKINTIMTVAILVASITFAAGSSMPGGNQGIVAKPIFHAFVICDIIALCSSIIVAVTLIWAQLCDNSSVLLALKFAILLIGIALAMVSIAFTARLYLVVIGLHWLAQAVLFMGIIFLITLVALFVPLCSSIDHIFRCISYYPFRLVLLAFESYADDDIAE